MALYAGFSSLLGEEYPWSLAAPLEGWLWHLGLEGFRGLSKYLVSSYRLICIIIPIRIPFRILFTLFITYLLNPPTLQAGLEGFGFGAEGCTCLGAYGSKQGPEGQENQGVSRFRDLGDKGLGV